MTQALNVNVEQYMERPCVCGMRRSEHAHGYDEDGALHVLAVNNPRCTGFLDAIELELAGSPLRNPLMRPILNRGEN